MTFTFEYSRQDTLRHSTLTIIEHCRRDSYSILAIIVYNTIGHSILTIIEHSRSDNYIRTQYIDNYRTQ